MTSGTIGVRFGPPSPPGEGDHLLIRAFGPWKRKRIGIRIRGLYAINIYICLYIYINRDI